MLPLPALADTGTIPGPITARVVSVYDGDTLTVDAEPWAGRYRRARKEAVLGDSGKT